jgi:hypothetical protein
MVDKIITLPENKANCLKFLRLHIKISTGSWCADGIMNTALWFSALKLKMNSSHHPGQEQVEAIRSNSNQKL